MKRRSAIALIVVVALVLVAALALRLAMRPQTLGPRILHLAGDALGLDLSATGFDYRLGRDPWLVARGVSAREPGASAAMIEAERVLVAVPWSTLRARGMDPVVTRVELDAPRLQLEPFLDWWGRRPRGDGPLPTLREGLQVERGRIDAAGWSLRDLAISVPHFSPDARLAASVRGRYQAAALQVPFDLHAAMTRPGPGAGLGVAGSVTPRAAGWHLPSRLRLSARLGSGAGPGFTLQRLRLSSASRYVSGETVQPFALGLAGEGAVAGGSLALAPAALALRGQGPVPDLDGRGRLDLGQALGFELAGEIETWPAAWPDLPPPIGGSAGPLPFELDYRGPADLSGAAGLRLARDDARFEGRLHLPRIVSWAGAGGDDSPLPPLDGRVTAPRVEVAGASLHGVEITIEDPAGAGEQP